MEVTFRSDVTAELRDAQGTDDTVVRAMLVSTKAADALEEHATAGRISFLMKNRHGTPFEHNSMTFFIEAPIFVFREFHRHRIGWSYNEVSGRYRELDPVFYVPGPDRATLQVGKPGAYSFVTAVAEDQRWLTEVMRESYVKSHVKYQELLKGGVAKEVARMVLPVGTYTAMFATCNARSLMAFLSLRTRREHAAFPSFPMREIEMVAEQMEEVFSARMPLTWAAFEACGRVAP